MTSFAAMGQSAPNFVGRSFLSGDATNLYCTALTTNVYGVTNQYSVKGTLRTNATGIADVSLWGNRDGSAPIANLNISLCGTNAAATNIITFVLQTIANDRFKLSPSTNLLATTGAQNRFTVAVTANGTTPVVVSTNVPASFMQGAQYVRLSSFGSSNAGTNVFINDVSLNGYAP